MSAPGPVAPPKPPTRISKIAAACVLVGVVFLIVLGMCSAGRAEKPPERSWIVWDVDADKPWTSRKGHQATATGPTACSLALHDATTSSPKGTRLACRRMK